MDGTGVADETGAGMRMQMRMKGSDYYYAAPDGNGPDRGNWAGNGDQDCRTPESGRWQVLA